MNMKSFDNLTERLDQRIRNYTRRKQRRIRRQHAEDTRIAKKTRMASMPPLSKPEHPVLKNEGAQLVPSLRVQHERQLAEEDSRGGKKQVNIMSNKRHSELVIKLVRFKASLVKRIDDKCLLAYATTDDLIIIKSVAYASALEYAVARLDRLIASESHTKPTGV